MTEQLKAIINELSNPPFEQKFTLITFDSLDSLQLLQVLSDVICVVEQQVGSKILHQYCIENQY